MAWQATSHATSWQLAVYRFLIVRGKEDLADLPAMSIKFREEPRGQSSP